MRAAVAMGVVVVLSMSALIVASYLFAPVIVVSLLVCILVPMSLFSPVIVSLRALVFDIEIA